MHDVHACTNDTLAIELKTAAVAVLLRLRSDERSSLLPNRKVFSTIAYQYLQYRDVSEGNNIDDELRYRLEKPSRVYVTLDSRSLFYIIKRMIKRAGNRGNLDFFYS